jgi:hypothetical protein
MTGEILKDGIEVLRSPVIPDMGILRAGDPSIRHPDIELKIVAGVIRAGGRIACVVF